MNLNFLSAAFWLVLLVIGATQVAAAGEPGPATAESSPGGAADHGRAASTASDETAEPDQASRAEEQATGPAESTEIETGRIVTRSYDFKDAGKEMQYALYVPKSYDGTKPYPLIVALHGLYSNPRQILGYPGFTKHAEEHGYVLVAPMGYNTRGWYGSRGTRGGRRQDPKNLGELSEKDVMNVLELTRREFKIDNDRIYLFGHSMGGGGALHLASKYPDVWAAMAPIAPAASAARVRLDAAKHIPAIVVQGDKDRLVSVHGTRLLVEKMKELEMDHHYIEDKGGGHVLVAFQHFPEIFEFFSKRKKP